MTPGESNALARECEVFCGYLTGVKPNAYVQGKYSAAHGAIHRFQGKGRFDQFLLNFATRSPALARLGDTYASLAARGSSLRRKLVLLVAILESCPPERGFRETVDATSQPLLYLKTAGRGALFLLRLLLSVIVLLPFHLALGAAGIIREGSR